MSEVAKTLRERRASVWEQAKALADRASDENRAFNGEEQAQWDTLNSELDALDRRIKAVIEGEQRAKDADEALERLTNGKSATRKVPGEDSRSDELRAFLRGDGPRVITFTTDRPIDYRDLSVGTATAGGNTVPTDFYTRLVEHMIEVSGVMRAGPTVLNTAGGGDIEVPKTTAHSTASIVSEGVAIGEDDPVFGQVTLGSFKYGNMTQLSNELLTDTGVDLEGYLARQNGRAIGNAVGNHFINGTGTGQPRGIITDATVGATGGTGVSGEFTGDDLIDLFFSVIEPYRLSQSCHWLMQDAALAVARKLKDTNGAYLWQPGLQAGVPDLLLGKPVVTDPQMPAVATNAKSVAFGDFSAYFVRTVNGVRFERSDDFAFGTDLVSFRALYRADGALVDLTGAIKVFQGAAT